MKHRGAGTSDGSPLAFRLSAKGWLTDSWTLGREFIPRRFSGGK